MTRFYFERIRCECGASCDVPAKPVIVFDRYFGEDRAVMEVDTDQMPAGWIVTSADSAQCPACAPDETLRCSICSTIDCQVLHVR